MVGDADAGVEPRTVVIHSLDTLVANVAVLGSGRLDDEACRAQLYGLDQLKEFLKERNIGLMNRKLLKRCLPRNRQPCAAL